MKALPSYALSPFYNYFKLRCTDVNHDVKITVKW